MALLLILIGAGFGALIVILTGVPGGSVLGAMLGGFVAATLIGRPASMPTPLLTVALVIVGAAIGIDLSNHDWRLVAGILPTAALSAVAIILSGIVIGLALHHTGNGPAHALLATSPGALTVLAGVAAEQEGASAEVAIFHSVRIIFVIASLPLLLRLLR